MRCFIDTSAFISLLNADDRTHARAKRRWEELLSSDASLVSSNYVLLETFTLTQHRLGLAAVRDFNDTLASMVEVEWIGQAIHQVAASALLLSGKRNLSLVDCTSFEIMRRLNIGKVFSDDKHFRDQGFQIIH